MSENYRINVTSGCEEQAVYPTYYLWRESRIDNPRLVASIGVEDIGLGRYNVLQRNFSESGVVTTPEQFFALPQEVPSVLESYVRQFVDNLFGSRGNPELTDKL